MSEATVVFATDRAADLALLSSTLHFTWWTTKGESTLETRLRYTPSDGYETFPRPEPTQRMEAGGQALEAHRGPLMLRRKLGLTAFYNRVLDPEDRDPDIERLREIHVEIDDAVREAYGWDDLPLGHGFHDTRQGTRFTISPDAQAEICDRLLELNHKCYAEEVRQGLHTARQPTRGPTRPVANGGGTPRAEPQGDALF